MVIVKLKGGLGNQMFQYAVGRRIAVINKVPLKLDVRWFNDTGKDTSREYELKHFKIKEEFATSEEIKGVLDHHLFFNFFGRFGKQIFPLNRFSYITESNKSFEQEVMNLKDNVYLNGVWANEKYFIDIKDLIKEEFQLKYKSSEANTNLYQTIESLNSIAVHVRRGDYVSNQVTNKYHGLCSIEYYNSAIASITERVKDPHFFLFSDDPQWVKDNIKVNAPTVNISHNTPGMGYEDLKLMKSCKHNIIANSSFSWWAAWLNSNPDKIIFAPLKWANNQQANSKNHLPLKWNAI